jgi:hypothetical protein
VSGNWEQAQSVPAQQLDADTILRTLVEHEVDFVVVGGLAVAVHGAGAGSRRARSAPRGSSFRTRS